MMMIDMLSIHFLLKKIKEMETVDVKTFVKLEATPLNLPDVFKRKLLVDILLRKLSTLLLRKSRLHKISIRSSICRADLSP